MKYIELSNGERAIVDDDDYGTLIQYAWHYSTHGYAVTAKQKNLNTVRTNMQRMVNKTPKGFSTDHINHNKLDNRKINLRTVTQSQNGMNARPHKGNKYKGVSYFKTEDNWISYITKDRKRIFLGQFETEIEAARAYNAKAKELYGEYAFLNDVEDGEYNRILRETGISGFRGVSYKKNLWDARISHKNKRYSLGYYKTAEEAAEAYDKKALELYGEKAILNFPKLNTV